MHKNAVILSEGTARDEESQKIEGKTIENGAENFGDCEPACGLVRNDLRFDSLAFCKNLLIDRKQLSERTAPKAE